MDLPVLTPDPYRVASDTWLIPTFADAPGLGYHAAHSLVIRGREPIVVDTGTSFVRDAWLHNAFSVVDATDVRWIFISHDDHDHIGNIDAVVELCPNATIVANFGVVGRLALDVALPLERMRWLEPGDVLDAGDRTLTLVRPPLFDSPSTRGFHDSATGLLWAVDSFGALFPGAAFEADDIPGDLYDESFTLLNMLNTPWMEWVDRDRFAAHVRAVSSLPIDVVTSAHGPVLRGAQIGDAFRRTLALAGATPPPSPGQPLLDLLAGSLAAPAAI
ncbi:MAG TPA: MBL fold metallo-hydrolase [Acidimicrobiia bacterium]|nr:MBL fold metallo-hydrolase [Acidimicrobiia bacterium]